jgi:hypothetical protein
MRAPARIGVAPRRNRIALQRSSWQQYLAAVEPAIAATPRVHRFARVPVLGEPELAPVPLAVWIETSSSDAADRTRAALADGTVGPAEVLEGPSLGAALARTRADRVVIVRAGDEPAPLALERLGQAFALAPDAAVITCDEDALEAGGGRIEPAFRPGPSPDRWLACDDSGVLLAVDRERAAAAVAESELGGGPGGRHELALRLAGPGAEHHAHVPMLLCHGGSAPSPNLDTDAVQRVLRLSEPGARIEAAGGVRRVRRPLAGEPEVEVIVCLRDRPGLLIRCAGTLLSRTRYERLRLAVVDNGSVQPDTAEALGRLARDSRVRILRAEQPFNFAALNNLAARSSHADVLVFLNNDTEVIDDDWLETLLEEALRPEVGAVAPMLLYPDGTVQHAGAALGLHGYAGHPFAGLRPDVLTPFGRAGGGTRNWLAVTAAFVVAGNDVDLCLRLSAVGHRTLCVPHAVLLHDESRSRGAYVDPGDFVTSERSYGAFRTVGDPFYNPNLTLNATDCGVRTPDGEGR